MKKLLLVLILSPGIITASRAQDKNKTKTAAAAPSVDTTAKAKKPSAIADKVKSSRKIDGMFMLYQDTTGGSLQMYVKKNQLGKEYIYQSFSINGPNSLYLNQSMHRMNFVFTIRKAFDKLEFSRVNTRFWYDSTNAVSKTAMVDKPEAVFLVEKTLAEDADGYLVNIDGLFLSEKLDPVKPVIAPSPFAAAMFNLGSLNPAKSRYSNVRSFPNNTDVVVDLAYDNPAPMNQGSNDITDARYIRVRMQHSLIEMPQNDFHPRRDDPRIGYFSQMINDQTSISPVPYKDIIQRWKL